MDDTTPVERIMTRAVVSTTPQARVEEAARLLRDRHISGLPVVGDDGQVLGVLTENDLVRDLHAAAGVDSPRGLLDLVLESSARKGTSLLEVCRNRLRKARVAELMTRPAVSIERSATLREAARRLRTTGTNRLPVVDESGRLVGIVTRSDVVAAISGGSRRARGALRPSPPRRPPRGAGDVYGDA